MRSEKDLLYTKDHMWIERAGRQYTLGVTAYGVSEMEVVLFADVPDKGSRTEAGDEIGSIESVKTVHPLLSPLSGVVCASNTALRDDPFPIAASPYGEGWLVTVEADGDDAPNGLMSYDDYLVFVRRGGPI
jgi:glycine cleavage system H protein